MHIIFTMLSLSNYEYHKKFSWGKEIYYYYFYFCFYIPNKCSMIYAILSACSNGHSSEMF